MDKETETTINRLVADKKMAVDLADYLIKKNVKLREALRYILTHCESDSPPNAKALILFVNNALKEGE